MSRDDEVEFAARVAPAGRGGRSSSSRARLVVGGWVLVLAGVAAVGLTGHGAVSPVGPVPPAMEPAEATAGLAIPAATDARATTPRTTTSPAVASPHRSLGNDGLVGGLPFGDNVRPSDGPS